MTVTGIIAEYNPLHKGHEYQLAEARRLTGADYVAVVMSAASRSAARLPSWINTSGRAWRSPAARISFWSFRYGFPAPARNILPPGRFPSWTVWAAWTGSALEANAGHGSHPPGRFPSGRSGDLAGIPAEASQRSESRPVFPRRKKPCSGSLPRPGALPFQPSQQHSRNRILQGAFRPAQLHPAPCHFPEGGLSRHTAAGVGGEPSSAPPPPPSGPPCRRKHPERSLSAQKEALPGKTVPRRQPKSFAAAFRTLPSGCCSAVRTAEGS